MKRFHVHVAVHDLRQSIRFYSAVFGAQPSVEKKDYAKWMLEDPRVNFAISIDPQGVAWESFHTLDTVPVFGSDTRIKVTEPKEAVQPKAACCPSSAQ